MCNKIKYAGQYTVDLINNNNISRKFNFNKIKYTSVYLKMDFSSTFLQFKCFKCKISCSNFADFKYTNLGPDLQNMAN